MSSCGGNCSCGSDCKCGNGCGCKRNLDFSGESSRTETLIVGVAPKMAYFDSVMGFGAENGCKCGSNCTCDNCACK